MDAESFPPSAQPPVGVFLSAAHQITRHFNSPHDLVRPAGTTTSTDGAINRQIHVASACLLTVFAESPTCAARPSLFTTVTRSAGRAHDVSGSPAADALRSRYANEQPRNGERARGFVLTAFRRDEGDAVIANMEGWNYGYSREYYDRFVQNQDSSVVNKFQQRYWKTKQTLIKVTGKKEDEHVVASDADLDAKLEVFHSIQRTCMELLKVIEQYQRRICFLSQEENELGRFLRSQGSQDRTRAGKIMQATGKALCFSSQQRLALRSPLCRLYQEVETFRYRAISDTWLTVNRMEQARTEYRGALLWMKDVSQELDPDTYKQMEKFRKVQAQVRLTKTGFDKLKNDVCQKVDLLGASRCNLLSHILTTYQTTLLHFWEKTSHTMAAIHESFKGYQPYEFTTLKTLQDPINKLLDQDTKKKGKKKVKEKQEDETKVSEMNDELVSFDDQNHNRDSSQTGEALARDSMDRDFFKNEGPSEKQSESTGNTELLSLFLEQDGGERDEAELLNEILSSSALEESDFSKEWREVFGDEESPCSTSKTGQAGAPQEESTSCFLPSQLLDQNMNSLQSSFNDWALSIPQASPRGAEQSADACPSANQPSSKATLESSKDLSTWYSLFADLDPLSNPDAIGKTDKEHELLNA